MGTKLSKTLGEVIVGLLGAESCKLPDIALSMSSYNSKQLNTNLRKVERLTRNKSIEVEDWLRRCYTKLVFDLLTENGFIIDKGQLIQINVDYTSSTDEFLILSASIPFKSRYIPLYFSMRLYPKKKGQMDQKKMEEAFFKELKHLLPTIYRYVIVEDRGFGNTRCMELCVKSGFEYIIRTNDNWNINYFGTETNIKKLERSNKDLPFLELTTSGIKTRLVTKFKDNSGRYLFTSLNDEDFDSIVNGYGQRFKIEKMFQDEKSSGFRIEESKIKSYDRFKRLLFFVYIAQLLTVFVGDFIDNNDSSLKKRYPIYLSLISVFSN